MRAKKVAIDPEIVYHSRAPIRQQKFPVRRSRAKQRQSLPARLEKQQSTLTQRWSFSSDVHDVEDDVEDIEDDDEEFEAERPKKRRRKTISGGKKGRRSLGERQNTMTQMGFVTSSFGPDLEKAGDDADGHETMLGSPEEDEEETEDDKEEEEEERVPESVSSQQETVSERAMGSRARRPAARPAKEPSAELPYTVGQPTTPRKHFPNGTEIPSSNTPMSAVIFSVSSQRTLPSPSKSPLLERSRNGLCSSGSMNVSPVRETPVKQAIAFSPYLARKADIFRRPDVPASRVPKLKHRSTIPDSEDAQIEETQPSKSPRRPSSQRKLRRVRSTIQETQFESLGQEVTAEMGFDELHHGHEDQTFGGTMDLSYPYYDTVAEALARDENRYGQTQRLQGMRRTMRPGVVLDTQEGSDLDLLASKSQLGTATDFTSLHNTTRPVNKRSNAVNHLRLGLLDDGLSVHSQSPPATPSNSERARHHPRFHDAEVVDLTADSFEPIGPIPSASPTPRTGSQAAIDVDRIIFTPSRQIKHISSSPPLVRSHENEPTGEKVELLPLNDVQGIAPLSSERSDLDLGKRIPTSQVSTVGHLTQAFISQRRRVRIKHEHVEDVYCSATTRRPSVDDYEDMDLDQEDGDEDEDEEVDIDDIVLSNADLNNNNPIEHIDLSDHIEPDADDDEHDYVHVDYANLEQPRTLTTPSSPLPAAPGHVPDEYDDVAPEEVSSDLAINIRSPKAIGSSQIGNMESLISYTSPPATHTSYHNGEDVVTPRAVVGKGKGQGKGDRGIGQEEEEGEEGESTPRPLRQGLSEKARGKMACYRVLDSQEEAEEEEEEEGEEEEEKEEVEEEREEVEEQGPAGRSIDRAERDDEHNESDEDDDDHYSYRFRRANEILPDTQFSVLLPLPPAPSSSSVDEYFAPLPPPDVQAGKAKQRVEFEEGKGRGQGRKRKEGMEDVSLVAPPKSSYGWKKNRGKK